MVLEELGVPYTLIPIQLTEVKNREYLEINPNGRIPAIRDPNTDVTLWESGAIIEYLIDKYDPENRLSFASDTAEYYLSRQWLFFQVSGQGPYYGQAAWFKKFHPEKIPSASERYNKEVNRVTGVLDSWLAQQKEQYKDMTDGDGPWLVGNRFSYADLVFISWQKITASILSKDEFDEDSFPHVKAWMDKMLARDSVKTVLNAAFATHTKTDK